MLFNLMPYFTASSDKNLLIRSPTLAFVIHIYVIYAFITRTNVSFNFSFPINSAKRKFPLTLRINTEQKFRYDHKNVKRIHRFAKATIALQLSLRRIFLLLSTLESKAGKVIVFPRNSSLARNTTDALLLH